MLARFFAIVTLVACLGGIVSSSSNKERVWFLGLAVVTAITIGWYDYTVERSKRHRVGRCRGCGRVLMSRPISATTSEAFHEMPVCWWYEASIKRKMEQVS